MPQTSVEKIMSRHSKEWVAQGDYTYVDVDFIMLHDGSAAFTEQIFRKMSGRQVFDPQKVALFFDHSAPSPRAEVSEMQKTARAFAAEQGIRLFDIGSGIGHQLVLEEGFARPGMVMIGTDSHCCTYGAAGAFASGLGPTDVAAALLTGQTWVKTPGSIKITFTGKLPAMVAAKDVALGIVGMLGCCGAPYQVLEFHDPEGALRMDERITICNMAIETEAKGGFFPEGEWLPDTGAAYSAEYTIDLSAARPLVAKPHQVENVCPVGEAEGTAIDLVFFGACTNGRYSDLEIAARILRGKQIDPRVRFMVTPASRDVMLKAMESGVLRTLVEAGAFVLVPGCGPCMGAVGGIPADGETVLSTANRNFLGRMANSKAGIYLCSPATAAASALTGRITDPRLLTDQSLGGML